MGHQPKNKHGMDLAPTSHTHTPGMQLGLHVGPLSTLSLTLLLGFGSISSNCFVWLQ